MAAPPPASMTMLLRQMGINTSCARGTSDCEAVVVLEINFYGRLDLETSENTSCPTEAFLEAARFGNHFYRRSLQMLFAVVRIDKKN